MYLRVVDQGKIVDGESALRVRYISSAQSIISASPLTLSMLSSKIACQRQHGQSSQTGKHDVVKMSQPSWS